MPARSEKQARFMRACAHGWKGKKCPSPEVARHFLHVAKEYDPDQPRAPKGSPEGGQWVSAGVSPSAAPAPLDADEKDYIIGANTPPGVKVVKQTGERFFALAGQNYRYAGMFDPSQPDTVHIWPERLDYRQDIAGIMAHEVQHLKFRQIKNASEREYSELIKARQTATLADPDKPRHFNLDSEFETVRGAENDWELRPGMESRFPATAWLRRTRDWRSWAETGTFTQYAADWWTEVKAGRTTITAGFDESLAEVARLQAHYGTAVESAKIPESWLSLYQDMQEIYRRLPDRIVKALEDEFTVHRWGKFLKVRFTDGRVLILHAEPISKAWLHEVTKRAWSEEDHPRGKTTDASTPGSFAPKEGDALPPAVDPHERDARARALGFDTDNIWYHGTFSNFERFDKEFANTEAYWGQGLYFSSESDDVEMNYTDPDSPDWSAKIGARAEEIQADWENDPDKTKLTQLAEEGVARYHIFSVAKEEAKQEMLDHGGLVLQTYLRMRYPMDLAEDGNEIWDVEWATGEDGEIDYDIEPSGKLTDFIDAVIDAGREVGLSDRSQGHLMRQAQELLTNYEGQRAREIITSLDKSLDDLYTDEDDYIGGKQLIAAALQTMGYDGIIMDASAAFDRLVMPSGTRHAIVFDPKNVRSIYARFDPKDSDSADLTKFDPDQPREPAGSPEGGQWVESALTQESVQAFADATKAEFGLEELDLRLLPDAGLRLELIMVPRDQRKRGVGTRAMERVVEFADRHGRRLSMSVAGSDKRKDWGTTSQARLERFYRRFGFVSNRGRYKDYALSLYDNMYRRPRIKKWLEEVAKYDPDQPRHPKGTSVGGRWMEKLGTLLMDALDRRLVDFKPDRSLSEASKTQPLAQLLPRTEFLPYSQVPFLDELHRRMGVEDPLTIPVPEYIKRRDAFFEAQTLTGVPLDNLVVTQPTVNIDRVQEIFEDPETGGNKPIQTVRYDGRTYIMNGHHRVAADVLHDNSVLVSRVWVIDELTKSVHPDAGWLRLSKEWNEAEHPRGTTVPGTNEGSFAPKDTLRQQVDAFTSDNPEQFREFLNEQLAQEEPDIKALRSHVLRYAELQQQQAAPPIQVRQGKVPATLQEPLTQLFMLQEADKLLRDSVDTSLAEMNRKEDAFGDSALKATNSSWYYALDEYIGSGYVSINANFRGTEPEVDVDSDLVQDYKSSFAHEQGEEWWEEKEREWRETNAEDHEREGKEYVADKVTRLGEENRKAAEEKWQEIVNDRWNSERHSGALATDFAEAAEKWAIEAAEADLRARMEEGYDHAQSIQELIDNRPPTDEPMLLYRGVKGGGSIGWNDLDPGDEITLSGFTSTSTKIDIASNFGSRLITILVPRGSRDVLMTTNDAEGEVLFNHGTRLQVLYREGSQLLVRYDPRGNDEEEEDDVVAAAERKHIVVNFGRHQTEPVEVRNEHRKSDRTGRTTSATAHEAKTGAGHALDALEPQEHGQGDPHHGAAAAWLAACALAKRWVEAEHPRGKSTPDSTPGSFRSVGVALQEAQAHNLSQRLAVSGGFTYQPYTTGSPTAGFALSILRGHERVFEGAVTEAQIEQYLAEHAQLLAANPQAHVGGWVDVESGKIYLDISIVEPDRGRAMALAREHGQEGIYDLAEGQTIIVADPDKRRKSEEAAAGRVPPGSDGQGDRRAPEQAAWLEVAKDWDESKHPRGKTTEASTPGSFAPKEMTEQEELFEKPKPVALPAVSDKIRTNDDFIVEAENALTRMVEAMEMQVEHQQAEQKLRELMANAKIKINRESIEIVRDLLLENGNKRMLTQHESGKSSGFFGPEQRVEVEAQLFGIEEDADVKTRPVYGILVSEHHIGSDQPDPANQYGAIQIYLKDSVKARTTFTGSDSLAFDEDRLMAPSPVNDPKLSSLFRIGDIQSGDRAVAYDIGHLSRVAREDINLHAFVEYSNYTEAQVHGGVHRDDIERIIFPSSIDKNEIGDIVAVMDKLGIQYEFRTGYAWKL